MDYKNTLFYYCKLDTAIEHILPKREILLNSIEKTNDPRENEVFWFSGQFDSDSQNHNLEENNKYISKLLRANTKVTCFSECHKHHFGYEYAKMWAHYGGNHSGVCLQIDKNEFLLENKEIIKNSFFRRIKYKEFNPTKPQKPHKNVDYIRMREVGEEEYLFKEFVKDNLEYLFFTKDAEWKSEREIRLLHFGDSKIAEFCSIKKSLKHIYIGSRFNTNYIPSIMKLAENIGVSQMQYTEVRLTAREIQSSK